MREDTSVFECVCNKTQKPDSEVMARSHTQEEEDEEDLFVFDDTIHTAGESCKRIQVAR